MLKTLRDSLLGTTAWYSRQCVLTWREKATKYNRSLFQLLPSERRTAATGYGSLAATPAATVSGARKDGEWKGTHFVKSNGKKAQTRLTDQVAMLKTPSASDGEGGVMEIREGADARYKLRDQIPHYTRLIPTPTTQEVEHPVAQVNSRGRRVAKSGDSHSMGLADTVAMLPTLKASDGEKNRHTARPSELNRHTPSTGAIVGVNTGLKLQPAFALWMMGFPPDWCDLEAGEMPPSKRPATRSSRKSPHA